MLLQTNPRFMFNREEISAACCPPALRLLHNRTVRLDNDYFLTSEAFFVSRRER